MNLERLRRERETLRKGIEFLATRPNDESLDQLILNYCFSTETLKLTRKFNCKVNHCRLRGVDKIENFLYHYLATPHGYGVGINTSDIFNRLWFKYFCKTTWFNPEIFSHLYEGIAQIYDEQKILSVQLSKVISGKQRAFFIAAEAVDYMKNFFAIDGNEKIISADNDESIQNLIKQMKKFRGKKVFFVLVGNYPAVHFALVDAGFEPGKDFINGLEF